MTASYTPMIEQYRDIKRRHAQEILFFRLGDFYEMFFQDAEIASRELDITLTSRDGGGSARIPMCGVPYHSAENYISRLVNKGYKVAICEQVEDPKQVKGLVRREVVKVITPGTILHDTILADKGNNYLVAVYEKSGMLSFAAADISTGECLWSSYDGPNKFTSLSDQLFHLMPAELVFPHTIICKQELKKFLDNRIPNCVLSEIDVNLDKDLNSLLESQFSQANLPDCSCAIQAISILLNYLQHTIKGDISHINRLLKLDTNEHLILDISTLRNLEIVRNMRDGGKKDTLLDVLDFTKTAMGGRLLRKWLEYPLLSAHRIKERHEAIAEFMDKPSLRQELQQACASIYDFERIITRIEVGTANGRDLSALKHSLAAIPLIKQALSLAKAPILSRIVLDLNDHDDMVQLIEEAIEDSAPFSVREGGIIRPGFNAELDELRVIATNSKQWIQNFEIQEREKSGIKSLKIGFNKVFGYYIEVTHANAAAVPVNYTRKQTLANAERYITPELKEFETKILGAQERIVNLEYSLFVNIRDLIKERIITIQESARQVAHLDTLLSFSEAACRYNYVRPIISENRVIAIKDGRHPVVERLLVKEMFVPNDVYLDHSDSELQVITGPNMAGKSTYMRQVALLVLMAQAGSFIPAREATISPVDRIFTRVGASDDLATGQSTFMVEMNEVAHILKHATANSLIILDEIGRGTSTFDGMSIARAVVEHIKERVKAKTLFATHYHELTELASLFSGIKNYTVAVKERGNEVVFLRRIIPGGADKSYGIHVAQLAGLPKKLIQRAEEILSELEGCQLQSTILHQTAATKTTSIHTVHDSLFSSPILNELTALDIMTITPIEALNILYRLHMQAKVGDGRE